MHAHTSRRRWTSAPMGALGLGRWHRWTIAGGRYADYRPHRWPMSVARKTIARTMGVRWCEPRGDQCLADCSTTVGTRWGRGKLDELACCRAGRGRVGQRQRSAQAGAHEAPDRLRPPPGRQLQQRGNGSGSGARLAHTRRPVRPGAGSPPAHAHAHTGLQALLG